MSLPPLPPLPPFLRSWWDELNQEAAESPSPLDPEYSQEDAAPLFALRAAFLDWVQDSPGYERAQDEIAARHAEPRLTLDSWEDPAQTYRETLDPNTTDLPPWARFWYNPQALLAAGGTTRRDVMRLPIIGPSWRLTGDLLANTLTYAGVADDMLTEPMDELGYAYSPMEYLQAPLQATYADPPLAIGHPNDYDSRSEYWSAWRQGWANVLDLPGRTSETLAQYAAARDIHTYVADPTPDQVEMARHVPLAAFGLGDFGAPGNPDVQYTQAMAFIAGRDAEIADLEATAARYSDMATRRTPDVAAQLATTAMTPEDAALLAAEHGSQARELADLSIDDYLDQEINPWRRMAFGMVFDWTLPIGWASRVAGLTPELARLRNVTSNTFIDRAEGLRNIRRGLGVGEDVTTGPWAAIGPDLFDRTYLPDPDLPLSPGAVPSFAGPDEIGAFSGRTVETSTWAQRLQRADAEQQTPVLWPRSAWSTPDATLDPGSPDYVSRFVDAQSPVTYASPLDYASDFDLGYLDLLEQGDINALETQLNLRIIGKDLRGPTRIAGMAHPDTYLLFEVTDTYSGAVSGRVGTHAGTRRLHPGSQIDPLFQVKWDDGRYTFESAEDAHAFARWLDTRAQALPDASAVQFESPWTQWRGDPYRHLLDEPAPAPSSLPEEAWEEAYRIRVYPESFAERRYTFPVVYSQLPEPVQEIRRGVEAPARRPLAERLAGLDERLAGLDEEALLGQSILPLSDFAAQVRDPYNRQLEETLAEGLTSGAIDSPDVAASTLEELLHAPTHERWMARADEAGYVENVTAPADRPLYRGVSTDHQWRIDLESGDLVLAGYRQSMQGRDVQGVSTSLSPHVAESFLRSVMGDPEGMHGGANSAAIFEIAAGAVGERPATYKGGHGEYELFFEGDKLRIPAGQWRLFSPEVERVGSGPWAVKQSLLERRSDLDPAIDDDSRLTDILWRTLETTFANTTSVLLEDAEITERLRGIERANLPRLLDEIFAIGDDGEVDLDDLLNRDARWLADVLFDEEYIFDARRLMHEARENPAYVDEVLPAWAQSALHGPADTESLAAGLAEFEQALANQTDVALERTQAAFQPGAQQPSLLQRLNPLAPTPRSRAVRAADAWDHFLNTMTSSGADSEELRSILAMVADDPEQLITGLDARYLPGLLNQATTPSEAYPLGRIFFGTGAVGNEGLAELLPMLRAMGGQLTDLPALRSRRLDVQAFRNQADARVFRTAGELYGVDEGGNLLTRGLNAVTNLQFRWAVEDFLNLNPGLHTRNALNALFTGITDTFGTVARQPDLEALMRDRGGGALPFSRVAEGAGEDPTRDLRAGTPGLFGLQGDYRSLFRLGNLGEWLTYQGMPNPLAPLAWLSERGHEIWTGDTTLRGTGGRVAWGEAAHFNRITAVAQSRALEELLPRRIDELLTEAEIPPNAVQALRTAAIETGMNGSRADVAARLHELIWFELDLSEGERTLLQNVTAQQILPAYDDAMAAANRTAQESARFSLLEPSLQRNIDQWLGPLALFTYFPSRTAANWARRTATNPTPLHRYLLAGEAIEGAQQEGDYPSRFEHAVPMGEVAGQTLLLGDPRRIVYPYDLFGGNEYADVDEAETVGELVLSGMQRLGVSPSPAFQALLDPDDFNVGDLLAQGSLIQRLAESVGFEGWPQVLGDDFDAYRRARKAGALALEGDLSREEALWAQDVEWQAQHDEQPLAYQPLEAESGWDRVRRVAGALGLLPALTRMSPLGLPVYPVQAGEIEAQRLNEQRLGLYPADDRPDTGNEFGSYEAVQAFYRDHPELDAWYGRGALLPDAPDDPLQRPGRSIWARHNRPPIPDIEPISGGFVIDWAAEPSDNLIRSYEDSPRGSEERPVALYALRDPRTNEPFYIGQSVRPSIRFREHLEDTDAYLDTHPKSRWTRELLRQGETPRMEVFDWVSRDEVDAEEQRWIGFFVHELQMPPERWGNVQVPSREEWDDLMVGAGLDADDMWARLNTWQTESVALDRTPDLAGSGYSALGFGGYLRDAPQSLDARRLTVAESEQRTQDLLSSGDTPDFAYWLKGIGAEKADLLVEYLSLRHGEASWASLAAADPDGIAGIHGISQARAEEITNYARTVVALSPGGSTALPDIAQAGIMPTPEQIAIQEEETDAGFAAQLREPAGNIQATDPADFTVVAGIGETIDDNLKAAGFNTWQEILAASDAQLDAVPQIGPVKLAVLRAEAQRYSQQPPTDNEAFADIPLVRLTGQTAPGPQVGQQVPLVSITGGLNDAASVLDHFGPSSWLQAPQQGGLGKQVGVGITATPTAEPRIAPAEPQLPWWAQMADVRELPHEPWVDFVRPDGSWHINWEWDDGEGPPDELPAYVTGVDDEGAWQIDYDRYLGSGRRRYQMMPTAPDRSGSSTSTAAAAPPSGADDFEFISGIGPVLEQNFYAAGITTLEQLATTDPTWLDLNVYRVGPATAAKYIGGAQAALNMAFEEPSGPALPAMHSTSGQPSDSVAVDDFEFISGIGPVLEQNLYAAGITTIQQLAGADPVWLDQQVERVGPTTAAKYIAGAQALLGDAADPVDMPEPGPQRPTSGPTPEAEPEARSVNPDLLTLLAKEQSIPAGYVPDLVDLADLFPDSGQGEVNRAMAEPLVEMFSAMHAADLDPQIVSEYRSYTEQAATYEYWRALLGDERAALVSARPGHSEHQLGTAIDFGSPNAADLSLAFATTSEGRWLADHGDEYGFVMSYPEGKTGVTGYAYEPWHFRFVGQEMATRVEESGLTLTEILAQPSETVPVDLRGAELGPQSSESTNMEQMVSDISRQVEADVLQRLGVASTADLDVLLQSEEEQAASFDELWSEKEEGFVETVSDLVEGRVLDRLMTVVQPQ